MTAMRHATAIKICGLREAAHVAALSEQAIDYVGFIFAKSRRQVSTHQAAELIRVLRKGRHAARAVGVFVNPDEEALREVLTFAPLDVIQLHGDESPAFCAQVKQAFCVDVWKVLSIGAQPQEEWENMLAPYADVVDAFLVDTYDSRTIGGSGRTFNWEVLKEMQQWAREREIPLMVAGGLDANNVGELLANYHPDGVDVSSGVETDGIKDLAKIAQFVKRVRTSEQ